MQGTCHRAGQGAQTELAGHGETGSGTGLLRIASQQTGHAVGAEYTGDTDKAQQSGHDQSQSTAAGDAGKYQQQTRCSRQSGTGNQQPLGSEATDIAGVEADQHNDATDIETEKPGIVLRTDAEVLDIHKG